jgi:hypothetical protein
LSRSRRFVADLAGARIGTTFNFYREGVRAPLRRERLAAYLDRRRDASCLLVGEAAGYRGARVSGLPFTAEIEAARPFLLELAAGRRVVPVGRLAHAALGGPYVRHPSHGGAAAFRLGLAEALRA